MSEEPLESSTPADAAADAATPGSDTRLVPVAEAIKYRRRAQQAEGQLQDLQQQLEGIQSQVRQHSDDLAKAEAQRDESQAQLTVLENRLNAERMLAQAGVVDIETASMLLAKRVDMSEHVDGEALQRGVEQVLLDKPFLRTPAGAALPPRTSPSRGQDSGSAAQLAQAAEAAARTGDRKDVANYLRLRRQTSVS